MYYPGVNYFLVLICLSRAGALISADEHAKTRGPNIGQLADIERRDGHSPAVPGTQTA